MDPPPPPPPDIPPPPSDLPPPPPSEIPPPPPPSDIPPPPDADEPVVRPKAKPKPKPTVAPVSVDELLDKKRKQDAGAKPKFLSKAQREKLKAKAGAEGAANGSPAPPATASKTPSREHRPHSSSRLTYDSIKAKFGTLDTKKPAAHEREKEKGTKTAAAPATASDNGADTIRKRYMGAETVSTFSAKRKRKRTAEKKFNFEWNATEDTSEASDLYTTQSAPSFFGRGKLGGYAESDGVERYAAAIARVDKEAGQYRAHELVAMQRRQKEEAGRTQLNVHWSEKSLENMRERDWRIFKEDFGISAKGGAIPHPLRSWSESTLPSRILDIIASVGYTDPSPVQRACIPVALQSRDLIGVAVTGSGKTAAFLLPLLVYISELPRLCDENKSDGPYAIILAPTRELAQQIETEAKRFATPLGYTVVSLVGGHSIEEQAYALRNGAELVIATPGRLLDCIERRVLVLSQCCYVIMDEADRMIDLGFEEPVNRILDALPAQNEKPDSELAEDAAAMSALLSGRDRYRQTMMYTATMPAAVERIARKYLRRPAIVTIGNAGEAVDTVEQRVEYVPGEEARKRRLRDILTKDGFGAPIIVFVNIKRNCDAVARDIRHMGFSTVTLHGSKTQDQREAALAQLRAGQADVLVATDLAGRGIDVQDVSLVVNFNMATSIESYTHRIGRTGRAGKSGVAITFWGNEDADVLYDLRQMLSKSEISKVPEDLKKHEAAQQRKRKVMAIE